MTWHRSKQQVRRAQILRDEAHRLQMAQAWRNEARCEYVTSEGQRREAILDHSRCVLQPSRLR